MRNPYCERLKIAVPVLNEILRVRKLKPMQAFLIALLEQGGPMTPEALEARVDAAGGRLGPETLVRAIRAAGALFFRDMPGRIGVNLSYAELDLQLFLAGLRPPKYTPMPLAIPSVKPDSEALTLEEVKVALTESRNYTFSDVKRAAAVLDAHGRCLTFDEIRTFILESGRRHFIEEPRARRWTSSLLSWDSAGRAVLNQGSPQLPGVRSYVRGVFRRHEEHRLIQERLKDGRAQYLERKAEAREQAARLRRAILHSFPEAGPPAAVTLLDIAGRSLRTWVGPEIREAVREMDEYDLLAGLHVRKQLERLNLEPDRWRLVDLAATQKSMTINRRGRTLRLTSEMLIRSTTGISKPLGDSRHLKGYLARGELGKLARRLESDAKALLPFYQYGVLHGAVRVRWGFLDESIPVGWSAEGDSRAYEILHEAKEARRPVDIVSRWAPAWSDPWSRAIRWEVVEVGYGVVQLKSGSMEVEYSLLEIQAIRDASMATATKDQG